MKIFSSFSIDLALLVHFWPAENTSRTKFYACSINEVFWGFFRTLSMESGAFIPCQHFKLSQ